MNRTGLVSIVILPVILASSSLNAGLSDLLDGLRGGASDQVPASAETTGVQPTDGEMIAGLKEALNMGTQYAVNNLGKDGGFLDNDKVRIPMPSSLAWIEKTLRTLRQEKLADEFVASMNHAAEQAVPEAATIFGEAIQNMSLDDARGILTGPDDAATQYFRRTTSDALTAKMRPIVEQSISRTGVTSNYKNMMAKAGGLTSLFSKDTTDLDGYVTEKTLDGLFVMVAEEEKRIRENPLARTTNLLKKVFGSY
ncbi:MAG: DUF4197 domain-containing protein [Gammaproteobacteria bacterium]